jgi:hypothetical protein
MHAKMQILSGEQTISPVTIPPKEIQDLRGLFSTYRLLKKQQTKRSRLSAGAGTRRRIAYLER